MSTDGFVTSYHELPQPALDADPSETWLKIQLDGSDGTMLTIRQVTIQDEVFLDPEFQEAVQMPWRQPLRFAAPAQLPGPTLKNRIMVGYQGWFRTANDRDDLGWFHWFRSRTDPRPSFYTFDMWPDTRAYPQHGSRASREHPHARWAACLPVFLHVRRRGAAALRVDAAEPH